MMTFKDFAQRIGRVLRGTGSQSAFTKSLFEQILPEDREDLFEGISDSTWKSYFNGNSQITRFAQRINGVADPEYFEDYIDEDLEGPAVRKLCEVFSDALPEINIDNAGKLLASLFDKIIDEAATPKEKKKAKEEKEKPEDDTLRLGFLTPDAQVAPDLAGMNGLFVIEEVPEKEEKNPFETYLQKAQEHYSVKPTLINREQPQPFYDIYVCADLVRNAASISGTIPDKNRRIKDATLAKLKKISKHIIVEGTGGIGKSMFLTHLFLSSAQQYDGEKDRVPILVTLKDYNENTSGLVELIWQAILVFDPAIEQKDVIQYFEDNRIDLLLDGLDEIPSALRESFYKDMEAFMKCYPGIFIILSSRPVHAPFPYGRFFTYEIEKLSLEQASELIRKIHFWDDVAKTNFLRALKSGLYYSHIQFASNPLLLTIMLMTYTYFGTSFDDMHVFYAKAYETMARLHDQTKGSYQRPLHTKLSPEEFAVYFSQFCARTYTAETFEFTELTFNSYMNKVIAKIAPSNHNLTPRDFALDLTDNLCLMYHEGEKYYFIHRSFQEYFAAVYFATDFETKLESVGNFFEKLHQRSYSDHAFDMLYGMIPQKVERNIFLPFLKKLISDCISEAEDNEEEEEERAKAEYWAFLERQYPYIYYEQGEVGESHINSPESFIYSKIREKKKLHYLSEIDSLPWPSEIYDLPTEKWVSAYRSFIKEEAFDKFPDPDKIPESLLDGEDLIEENDLPYRYTDYFGKPDLQGIAIEIEIYTLLKNPDRHKEVREFMELEGFPLMEEYKFMKAYCAELESEKEREAAAQGLFDD